MVGDAMLHNSSTAARYPVLLGAAILLTFERTGFLSFAGRYLSVDMMVNVFVVLVAAPLGLMYILRDFTPALFWRYWPIIAFWAWILLRGVVFGGGGVYGPSRSSLISCIAGVILSSHVMRWELPRLRRCLVLLSATFVLLVLYYERDVLLEILGGGFTYRLGKDISPGVAVAFPRTVYVLVIACLASVICERNIVTRTAALFLIAVPMLLGFATAGRGGLLGLAVATLVFTIGLPIVLKMRRKATLVFGLVSVCVLVGIAYHVAITYFPFLVERLTTEGDSGRFEIWAGAISKVSLFGRGAGETYAHNMFLETLQDYGIVGCMLLSVVLFSVLREVWRAWRIRPDLELLWVTSVLSLQLTCQQFSLDLYWGFFWTALVLPLGLNEHVCRGATFRLMRQAAGPQDVSSLTGNPALRSVR